jgi:PleD family two-component response regulator
MVQDAWKAGATKCLSKSSCTPKQVLEIIRSTLTNGTVSTGSPVATAPGQSPPQARIDTPSLPPQVGDTQFQTNVRISFVDSLPSTLSALRALLQAMIKADTEANRLKQVQELYRRIHALTSNAALAGVVQVAQMADALEALLKELYEKPKNINASTLRTVANAIDFLGKLFDRATLPEMQELPPANILVVDDDALSRRAITYALEKARLKSINVEDPKVALNLLSENKFDLVFLDVDMPVMNGFELCTKLRGLPAHKKTPVVFVTSLNDFESRASSMMSGGNDFIAKPFLFIELAVKALVYVLRGRLEAK